MAMTLFTFFCLAFGVAFYTLSRRICLELLSTCILCVQDSRLRQKILQTTDNQIPVVVVLHQKITILFFLKLDIYLSSSCVHNSLLL